MGVNKDTLPLAAMEAMQFGWSLKCILWEILFDKPAHGPVQMIKLDISDSFYRIGLNIDDIPKLGVVFPMLPGDESLIAFLLVLPMGWTNSPPIFSTATETIADTASAQLGGCHQPIPWMSWLLLFLPHLTRLTGDPSQQPCLSFTLIATPLFQPLEPLLLMWIALWMTLWVWLRNTSSEYVVPFWKLSIVWPLSPSDPPTR